MLDPSYVRRLGMSDTTKHDPKYLDAPIKGGATVFNYYTYPQRGITSNITTSLASLPKLRIRKCRPAKVAEY